MSDYEVKPPGNGAVADYARVCFLVAFSRPKDEEAIKSLAKEYEKAMAEEIDVDRVTITAIYPIWD